MDKQKVIDYIMDTPENSNPNVLKTILEDSNQNSGVKFSFNPPNAFPGTDFSKYVGVVIGEDIETIKSFNAFSGLEKVDIKGNPVYGDSTPAFTGCANLKEVNAPQWEKIPDTAFAGLLYFKKINAPNIKEIGNSAFANNLIEEVDFPNCTKIGNSSFYQCTLLKKMNFSVVESIGDSAFKDAFNVNCELIFPNCKTIGKQSFFSTDHRYNNPLKAIDFSNLEKAGEEAFQSFFTTREAVTLVFPKLQTIENGCFKNCNTIEKLILPCVKTIGSNAFAVVGGELFLGPNIQSIDENGFSGIGSNAIINCAFSENDIEGAPWGAGDGVTINYNVPIPSNQ